MKRRRFVELMGFSAMTLSGRAMGALVRDHVIVAGAGIIGASIAYHLAKRGARVTVLEKEHPAAGTTKNSFAWLNAASKSPRSYYELNLAGMAGWRRLELELGPSLPIQWGGGVEWCKPNDEATAAMKNRVRERQGWGYSVRMVDREELLGLIPYAKPNDFGGACFADQEGTVDPVVAAEALVTKARALGAEVLYPCEVTNIKNSEARVRSVETTQGVIEADHLILATGNGTMELAAKVGFNIPLKESKGILAHGVPEAHFVDRVIMPPHCNIKQNLDGRVVTGTNFEDTGDLKPTRELGDEYLRAAAQYVPELAGTRLEYMTLGYRVMPKDEHPIIGRSAKLANLYVAVMHSGMTLAPIVGQLVAMEILDQASVDLLQPYRPDRFA